MVDCCMNTPNRTKLQAACSLRLTWSIADRVIWGPRSISAWLWFPLTWLSSQCSVAWNRPLPRVAVRERVSTKSKYLSTGNSCVCTMKAPNRFFFFFPPQILIRVVFKPWSNFVLRKPLKMSQEGQKSQTVGFGRQWLRKCEGTGPRARVFRTLCRQSLCLCCWCARLCHVAQPSLLGSPSVLLSCSQLEVLMSSASQGPADTADGTEGQWKHTSPHTSCRRSRCPASLVLPE